MEITSSIDIARPPDDVFAVIADMSRNVEWQDGMRSCAWTSEPPIRVGSTYQQTAEFRGREIVTTFEVAEYEAPTRIRIVSVVSTFPLDVTRTVQATASGSRVTALVKGDPPWWMRLAGPLLRRQVRRSVDGDYVRLKALLEG